jgi:hypothetical protein
MSFEITNKFISILVPKCLSVNFYGSPDDFTKYLGKKISDKILKKIVKTSGAS